jgi:RNA polymerase sigma-70 factor (ECF subfamily)
MSKRLRRSTVTEAGENLSSRSDRWTALLMRAQRGESAAFERLMDEAQPVLWARVFARLGDEGLADEVAARTFGRAWENLDSYDPELSSAPTWLMTIADRLALDAMDGRRRQQRREVIGLDAPAPEAGEEETPAGWEPEDDVELAPPEAADRPFRRALVEEALARLSKTDRTLLRLRDVEGLGYEEIARRVGCSLKAVGPRLSRARERLRQALDPEVRP